MNTVMRSKMLGHIYTSDISKEAKAVIRMQNLALILKAPSLQLQNAETFFFAGKIGSKSTNTHFWIF